MKTAFELNSNKPRLFIPVSKFAFAAYPVQVHQSLRLPSMTGRPPTISESERGKGLGEMIKLAVTVLLLSVAFQSDLGGWFEFTDHAPGLNLQMLSAAYSF